MPNMANITVKKADGTTDIVYTASTPSAGDQSPAVWRANAVSSIIGHRPKLSLVIRDNAAKTGRVFQGSLLYPHTFTNVGSGEVKLIATTPIRFEGTLPNNVSASEKKEAIYQVGNLLINALMRAALEEEYAPT